MLGMAWCAGLEDLAALPRDEIVYRPRMAPEDVSRRYEGWRSAVSNVLQPG
jgi:hypothetical protein